MPLQSSNSGAIWTEPAGSGAALETIPAGYKRDVNNRWIASIEPPFTGRVLDIAGNGNFVLTDVSGGVPAFVAELHLAQVGGHFITYL